MGNSVKLEYMLETKTHLSNDNGQFKCEVVPNDYTYLVRFLYKDNELTSMDNYPETKEKIGIKVILMRLGIVFKEIIIKSKNNYYVSIIYNDYLNIFYSAVGYSEDMSLYMVYRKALSDIVQSVRGTKSQSQSVRAITSNETFEAVDYLFTKFCQDVEQGLINEDITATDLNLDDNFNDFKVKFYELSFGLKKSDVHFVLGRLINRNNELLSEKVYFNNKLTTAVDKVYFLLFEDIITRQLYKDNIDWTTDIDYESVFKSCENTCFNNIIDSKINIKEVDVKEFEKMKQNSIYTKSLIDFYQVSKIKIQKFSTYIFEMYLVDTGFDSFCKEPSFLDRVTDFEQDNDIYWKNLKNRLNTEININYIGD